MRMQRLSAIAVLSSAVLLASCSEDPTAPDAGSAVRFVIVSGSNQVGAAGEELPQPVQVQALDANQQPVPDVVVNFVVTAGGGSVFAGSALTDAGGMAAEIWRLGQTAGSTQTLEVRAVDANGVRHTYGSFSATAVAGAPVTVAAFDGTDQSATVNTNVAIAPAVLLEDKYGNPVPNQTVTFAVSAGGGSITGGSAISDNTGVARVGGWKLGPNDGLNTLTATATALPGSPIAFSAMGTGGGAMLIFGTAPATTAQSGVLLSQQPAVQLVDGQNVPLAQPGLLVTAALIGPNGVLNGTTTVATDANGLATFTDLSIAGQMGSYTLRFDLTGYPSVSSSPIDLQAGTVASVVYSVGDGQSVNAGTAVPILPAVLATDSWGNPVAGISITFSVVSGGGSITGATAVTDANGLAQVGSWQLGPLSGPNSLTATIPASGFLVTFNATALGNFWSSRAGLIGSRRYAVSGVINGRYYVAGGKTGSNTVLRTVEMYDPATDTWTSRASMPTGVAGASSSVINGILYVVGGINSSGQTIATVQAYDPAANSWSIKAPMPSPRKYGGAAAINGILYFAGGSSSGIAAELFAYNPASNSWTQKASLPMARVDVWGVALNGQFYLVGGTTKTTVDGGLYVYDPQSDSWTQKASMNLYRYHLAAEVVNGQIYAVGGFAIGGAVSGATESYDPLTDTWTPLAPLAVGRVAETLGEINGLLYSAGGVSTTATLTTTEAFVP